VEVMKNLENLKTIGGVSSLDPAKFFINNDEGGHIPYIIDSLDQKQLKKEFTSKVGISLLINTILYFRDLPPLNYLQDLLSDIFKENEKENKDIVKDKLLMLLYYIVYGKPPHCIANDIVMQKQIKEEFYAKFVYYNPKVIENFASSNIVYHMFEIDHQVLFFEIINAIFSEMPIKEHPYVNILPLWGITKYFYLFFALLKNKDKFSKHIQKNIIQFYEMWKKYPIKRIMVNHPSIIDFLPEIVKNVNVGDKIIIDIHPEFPIRKSLRELQPALLKKVFFELRQNDNKSIYALTKEGILLTEEDKSSVMALLYYSGYKECFLEVLASSNKKEYKLFRMMTSDTDPIPYTRGKMYQVIMKELNIEKGIKETTIVPHIRRDIYSEFSIGYRIKTWFSPVRNLLPSITTFESAIFISKIKNNKKLANKLLTRDLWNFPPTNNLSMGQISGDEIEKITITVFSDMYKNYVNEYNNFSSYYSQLHAIVTGKTSSLTLSHLHLYLKYIRDLHEDIPSEILDPNFDLLQIRKKKTTFVLTPPQIFTLFIIGRLTEMVDSSHIDISLDIKHSSFPSKYSHLYELMEWDFLQLLKKDRLFLFEVTNTDGMPDILLIPASEFYIDQKLMIRYPDAVKKYINAEIDLNVRSIEILKYVIYHFPEYMYPEFSYYFDQLLKKDDFHRELYEKTRLLWRFSENAVKLFPNIRISDEPDLEI